MVSVGILRRYRTLYGLYYYSWTLISMQSLPYGIALIPLRRYRTLYWLYYNSSTLISKQYLPDGIALIPRSISERSNSTPLFLSLAWRTASMEAFSSASRALRRKKYISHYHHWSQKRLVIFVSPSPKIHFHLFTYF